MAPLTVQFIQDALSPKPKQEALRTPVGPTKSPSDKEDQRAGEIEKDSCGRKEALDDNQSKA
jgi:hypothetical protein